MLRCRQCDGMHVGKIHCSGKKKDFDCVFCDQPVRVFQGNPTHLLDTFPVECTNGHNYGHVASPKELQTHYKSMLNLLRAKFCDRV